MIKQSVVYDNLGEWSL